MRRSPMLAALVFAGSLWAAPAAAQGNGLVAVQSAHTPSATVERLSRVLNDRGMRTFASIDHAAGAAEVGSELRPTHLIIFGNPNVGSRLMACAQSVAIDLPMKFLVWEDAEGEVWIGYNDPGYLARRHSMSDCREVLGNVGDALRSMAFEAAEGEGQPPSPLSGS